MISQNGIPVTNGVQQAIGPHWGHVTGVRPARGRRRRHPDRSRPAAPARRRDVRRGLQGAGRRGHPLQQPARPGRAASPSTSRRAPAATTRSAPTTAPGTTVNPATGEPYPSDVVHLGRLRPGAGRVLGRRPEVGDAAGPLERARERGLGRARPRPPDRAAAGEAVGPPRVGREDVPRAQRRRPRRRRSPRGASRATTTAVRPISMIRYMGGHGQSSDPSLPSYDPEGLPLVPGLIELITDGDHGAGRPPRGAGRPRRRDRRSAPGPATRRTRRPRPAGSAWILAVDWVPYQLPTFVTPAFPGYISGHSTFSRAAAEVLTGVHRQRVLPGW